MNFINENKNIIIGLAVVMIVTVVTGYSYGLLTEQPASDSPVILSEEIANDIEEITVVADDADFLEKANEAAVANQVNAAVKRSEDSDGLPDK